MRRVARLLDPREQEHAVVGREPEGDREQQDRHASARARPGSGSRAGPRGGRPGRSKTRMPKTALRLSTFISSCLIGSTTEPVIRKRTIRVDHDHDRQGDRQVRREAVLEVDEVRRGASDQQLRAAGDRQVAHPLHRVAGSGRRCSGRSEIACDRRRRRSRARCGGLHRGDARLAGDDLAADRAAAPPAVASSTASRIGVSWKGGNSARITSSTWRALALSGSTCASTEVNLIEQERDPEHDQEGGGDDRDPRPGGASRSARAGTRSPALAGPRVALGASLQEGSARAR